MASKKQAEITSNAIYKVTGKDGQTCYAIESDNHPGLFYKTCYDYSSANWTCTCKSGEFAAQRGSSATCKHAKAAQLSILANKKQNEEQAKRPSEKGSLNGNRPFSLLA